MPTIFDPNGFEIGNRDIVIDQDNKTSVKVEATLINQNAQTEMTTEEEIESVQNVVKVEFQEQKFVVVNHEKIIYENDDISDTMIDNKINSTAESCTKEKHSVDLPIKAEIKFPIIDDMHHGIANLEKVIISYNDLSPLMLC